MVGWPLRFRHVIDASAVVCLSNRVIRLTWAPRVEVFMCGFDRVLSRLYQLSFHLNLQLDLNLELNFSCRRGRST